VSSIAFGQRWSSYARLALAFLISVSILLATGGMAGAALPDGRAWEMVSPLDKNGGDVLGNGYSGGGLVQASSDGEAIAYFSEASFGEPQGAPIASQYVASRDAGTGWLTENISLATNAQTYNFGGLGTPYRAFSEDLSSGLMWGGTRGGSGPVESPSLAGAPEGYENYYLHSILNGALQPLLNQVPNIPAATFSLQFVGNTPDLAHDIVQSRTALKTGETVIEGPVEGEGFYLYEWEKATGLLQLLNVLPDGVSEPANSPVYWAVSEDGSRVVWTAESAPSGLYLRQGIGTGHAQTVQVDAPTGDGFFLAASSDARRIFFADGNSLTGDPQDSGGLGDLYLFEADAGGGHLVDLTVDAEKPGGAEVQGVLGASADGSYLYFVANGVLASNSVGGSHALQGDCQRGMSAPEDMCNLYVWHEGEGVRFIATLSSDDERDANFNSLGTAFDWSGELARRTSRVSRDGTRLVFMSERSLTGYDNTVSTGVSCGADSGKHSLPAQCQEVFLYEASPDGSGRLSCVSCNPSGARPIGPSSISGGDEFEDGKASYQSRALSEGQGAGRVFFDSADALVPGDTNHAEDVYEYEDDHVYLLSGGQGPRGSSFVDASVDGDDVFFLTREQLVGQDTDQLVDLYDARAAHVPGEAVGFPAPPPPVACAGEDCRVPAPPAPVFEAPSSSAFVGLGNVAGAVSAPATPVVKVKPKAKPKKPKTKRKKVRRAKRSRVGVAHRAGGVGR
jgi:hypothetical protein